MHCIALAVWALLVLASTAGSVRRSVCEWSTPGIWELAGPCIFMSPPKWRVVFSDKLLKSWLKWRWNQIRQPICWLSYGLRQNWLGVADKLEFLIAGWAPIWILISICRALKQRILWRLFRWGPPGAAAAADGRSKFKIGPM